MEQTSFVLILVCVFGSALTALARPTVPAPGGSGKVGIFDSRVIAFAYFWSDAGRRERNALMTAATDAKVAGDMTRFKELAGQLTALQKKNHLQVFSTEPIDEQIASLEELLPLLQVELGVNRFVSKWDEAALAGVPEPNRVDVTDRLIRAFFTPTEKQAKMLAAMRAMPPIPLVQARKIADEGRM